MHFAIFGVGAVGGYFGGRLAQAGEDTIVLPLQNGVEAATQLSEDIVSTTLDFMDYLPPNGTTSMQRNIAEGRPSEIEAYNGAVVRLGGEAGVAVSLHEFIYDSLLPLEKKARGELQFPA